jgi:Zn-dependent protease with chaperone function
MGTAPVALLDLPILVWVAVGIGLLATYRGARGPVVFRLAALFLACWAIFATTGLVWVVSHGGWPAVVDLAHAPLLLFAPQDALWWAVGALGAFVVFLTAFVLSQAVGRGFVALFRTRPLPWPTRLSRPGAPTALLAFASDASNAFTFTLLEVAPPLGLRRRDVILISEGLLARLTEAEFEAVVAHEAAHVRRLDSRYLTFFRTLARMMRWDPILAVCADRLTLREEFRADLDAVASTGRPRALARALYKASRAGTGAASPLGGQGFLGRGGRWGRRDADLRIRRLVELAESGRYPEEAGG